jgi:RepB DNA-primase from phage plasmid/Relaxase/Mobilisation nuclease domain
MIAKAVKGKGFRGALEYDLTKEGGQVLDTNMAGENPRELAAEFGEIRKLRPNLGKAVLHVSLSAAPGENLTDEQWREIGKRYIDGMGLEKNQFIVTRHTDTEHEHIHILANRIRFDGSVTSDSQDYKRQEAIMRELERDYGLQRVAPSIEAERKAPTKGEIEGGIRTGQPSAKQQLQQLCDGAAKDCHSFTEYQERLDAAGVELVPVAQLEGAKLSGLSYRLDGVTMKGSDLGKAYSPAGLAKRGVTYEQDRDFAAVRASVERDTARAFGEPDRDSAADQAPERGGLGRDAGAVGAGAGRTDGRDTADAGRDQPQDRNGGKRLHQEDQPHDSGMDRRSDGSGRRGDSVNEGREADGVAALRPDPVDRVGYSGARERVLALAEAADRPESTGRESGSRVPEARRDRSLEAIQRQINALDVPRFEVGIRESKTGQMMNREWSRAEVEQSTAWLKRMNAKGNDVYIRPAGDHGLVLVDDLTADKLSSMHKDGFPSAATIETSPGNYQVWVKLSDKPLSAESRRIAAQGLAKQYGGDMNSADSRHYGRLAGFTNQKPQHTRDGRQPYVLAHDCPGKAATAAPAYLERIEQSLDRAEAQKERKTRLEAIKAVSTGHKAYDPVREYQRQAQRLLTKYGDKADLSRMDWMIATDMAKSGNWTQQDVEKGIREASPALESRKTGHIEDYAKRTAEKAWAAPEVQQHRQEQAREAKRDRDSPGMSR